MLHIKEGSNNTTRGLPLVVFIGRMGYLCCIIGEYEVGREVDVML